MTESITDRNGARAVPSSHLHLTQIPRFVVASMMLLAIAVSFPGVRAVGEGIAPVIPSLKTTQVVLASADETEMSYLAFPSVLRTGPNEVLLAIKRGHRHGGDDEAMGEIIRFDTARNRVAGREIIARDSGFVMQMGECVLFPNGDIGSYFDVQKRGHDGRNYRTGMQGTRLRKGSGGFGGLERVPLVGGIEYGYPFDFIVQDNVTYMLVMAFGYRPGERWSVDVIRSVDNGSSWEFVRNLTEEFGGHRINESAFIPWEDGFLVTTRAYGNSERIYRTDRNFRMLAEADLSADNVFMESHIGRPRLFVRDGAAYLLGRNWRTTEPHGRKMELGLFRIDPADLRVTKWAILDNAERANVTDGYYAVSWFQERDDRTWFNCVTYKALDGAEPDIVRLEFDWDELR